MRKKIVAGNWKMNLTLEEGIDLAKSLNTKLSDNKPPDVDVIICTPFTHIYPLTQLIDKTLLHTGAQNCSDKESGAYTGEISAAMIKSAGAAYVIIGHSERRAYFKENNELLNAKVKSALGKELKVIFCIGESLEQRQSAKHFDVVKDQLENGIFDLDVKDFSDVIIAYEPVWAIGTGVTASSDQAQEMHAYIRSLIAANYDKQLADNTTILYGGSCNAGNAAELFSMKDVDGGLIGGASLKADDFISIIKSY
ncbi:MAG: triose-phosphate isomerase [Marinilabiliaceae bacterium]|jgi:triosephosphate isomerase|nr:triose-phosphate isomerase [Marinilabiliaceae bacterium]